MLKHRPSASCEFWGSCAALERCGWFQVAGPSPWNCWIWCGGACRPTASLRLRNAKSKTCQNTDTHTHKLFQLSLRSKRLYKLSLCHTPHNNKKKQKTRENNQRYHGSYTFQVSLWRMSGGRCGEKPSAGGTFGEDEKLLAKNMEAASTKHGHADSTWCTVKKSWFTY